MAKELIDIRDLVKWALVDQQVEAAVRAANVVMGRGGMVTSTARLESVLKLGCKVDGSAPTSEQIITHCHSDAIEVYDNLCRLPAKARDLVYFHCLKASAPDWLEEGVGPLVPKLGKNGKPVRLTQSMRGASDEVVIKNNVRYLMTYEGYTPHDVRIARAEYAVWYEGLVALSHELENTLERYIVQPPNVRREPWERLIKKVG